MEHKKARTRIITGKIENEHMNITYPQLKLKRKKVQHKINKVIVDMMQSFIEKETNKFLEQRDIYGEYKITLDKRNLLSLVIEFYSCLPGQNIAFNLLKSLTINTREAYIYNFNDLFYEGSNYEYIINKIILEDIKENSIPIIEEFANINKNRRFYLTEDCLVIYYELNKNSKYAYIYSAPQFIIPFNSIKDIINTKGPIVKLLYGE
ncbi:RsiV family protein [Clostridium sp. OS1-26]|uniref:RsiV family protein n=1 Tax=Clostridium sp. OS1-26 TaxID=3070681 RepID=UPI0027E03B88|nr:RsiV family protein [Clostridium sp. OS1-26]WML37274.1 RsiV family protein [Clostridium sp. OS1-26]